jgi:hypothetical protein
VAQLWDSGWRGAVTGSRFASGMAGESDGSAGHEQAVGSGQRLRFVAIPLRKPACPVEARNLQRIAVMGSVYVWLGHYLGTHQKCIHQGQRRDATCHRRSNAPSRSLSWSIQSWAALCVAKSEVVQDDSPCLVSST